MSKVYEGTTGLEVLINMQQDISDATVHNIIARKDGENETWAAEVYEDNYLRYVIEDAVTSGTYYLHPSLTLDGWSGPGDWCSFTVYPLWK